MDLDLIDDGLWSGQRLQVLDSASDEVSVCLRARRTNSKLQYPSSNLLSATR